MQEFINNLKEKFNNEFIKLVVGILNLYHENNDGHGKDHIITVITNTLEYITFYKLNETSKKIVVLGAVCHDLGLIDGDRSIHHYKSASLVYELIPLRNYFNDEIIIHKIAECCLFHRASNNSDLNHISLEAKIVADCDNDFDINTIIRRSIQYHWNKNHYNKNKLNVIISNVIEHMEEKFSRTGYAKFILELPPKFKNIVEERYHIVENKKDLFELVNKIALEELNK